MAWVWGVRGPAPMYTHAGLGLSIPHVSVTGTEDPDAGEIPHMTVVI